MMKMLGPLVIAAVLVCAQDSSAQGTTPIPLAKVVVSDEVARGTLLKNVINSQTARQIVDACLDWARTASGFNVYAIFVVAPNSDVIAAQVMDGVLPLAIEAALLKAKTALFMRAPTTWVMERYPSSDARLLRMDLGRPSGGAMNYTPGGFPIVVENQLIGALGIGGDSRSEECGREALTKILGPQLPPPPLKPGVTPGTLR